MVASRLILLLLLTFPLSLFCQDRYFVSFKDKSNTPYSISNPLQFLSQKSIDRRAKENFTTSTEDLPVDPLYVAQVKATGASVFFTSRWFNGVLIQASKPTATSVSNLSFVSKVELVAPGTKLLGGRKSTINKFERASATNALQNYLQLEMIGLDKMQSAGYHGEGIDVAVFDGGFIGVNTLAAFQSIYQEGRLKSAFNFVNNSTDVYSASDHGTEVLSVMAGNISNTYLGGAYKANFFLYQTEDVHSEYRVEEYNWAFAAERADSAGVYVINSSLGYNTFDDRSMDYSYEEMDGKTSVVSRAAYKAFERGIVVVNSAGNEGDNSWKYIDVPADAVGVIACGAVDYSGYRSPFSSVGPNSNGKIKPDVSALGDGSVVILSSGNIGSASGTSFSSPLVASLVIGLRQALSQASAKEIYQRVINSASQASRPDNMLGYGIPNFSLAKDFLEFSKEFQIYPNPVIGELKIIFKYPIDHTFMITTFNLTGQKVFEFSDFVSWDNNPYTIDLSTLTAGLYLVKVQTPTSSQTVRIVKVN
jgi:serine protease AprX